VRKQQRADSLELQFDEQAKKIKLQQKYSKLWQRISIKEGNKKKDEEGRRKRDEEEERYQEREKKEKKRT
jgi:hypothetical protein